MYDRYVERMEQIREKLQRAKPLKSKPGPQGPIITTKSGAQVELVKSVVATSKFVRVPPFGGSETLHWVEDLKPIADEKFAAVVQAAHHSAVAAGRAQPVAATQKVAAKAEPTRPKKRASKSRKVRDELRAAKAAATLASTLSTAQKDAARAGAKVVKDQGGWSIVVKGAPDATRKGEVAWRRRVAKRFVTKKVALFVELAAAIPQFPQSGPTQAQVSLEKVFWFVKKAGLELAF
jgi:hypothetical protein